MSRPIAWELIGYEGLVRIVGGRTVYESVVYNDSTPGAKVRLSRLDTSNGYIRQVNRWVDPDTELEIL